MAEYIEREAAMNAVAEVKHGQWNESFAVGFSGTKYYMYNCSVCGCLAIDKDKENYCHNCGAKMDGGRT